jgi:hypothetical protein
MKDLELKDILNRQDRPLGRLTIYLNGRWSFAGLTNPVRVTAEQFFFKIPFVFGLTKSGVTDPRKFAQKGEAGAYVSQDRQRGQLAIVTEDQYLQLFPLASQTPTPPESSELLRDPNYLTKTQVESVNKDSDKVLVGDKTFSITSTLNKTLTIVDTPAGQAQVSYDSSGGAVVYNYDTGMMEEVDTPAKPGTSY